MVSVLTRLVSVSMRVLVSLGSVWVWVGLVFLHSGLLGSFLVVSLLGNVLLSLLLLSPADLQFGICPGLQRNIRGLAGVDLLIFWTIPPSNTLLPAYIGQTDRLDVSFFRSRALQTSWISQRGSNENLDGPLSETWPTQVIAAIVRICHDDLPCIRRTCMRASPVEQGGNSTCCGLAGDDRLQDRAARSQP